MAEGSSRGSRRVQEGSRNEVQDRPWLPAESLRPRASELHERLWQEGHLPLAP